jgi:hypothetical protein
MAVKIKNICCTFDVDLTDYFSVKASNEMMEAFPVIQSILEGFPKLKTTWFIRIDEQISKLFGDPLYIFKSFANEISWLKSNGHEIGWHHHAYSQKAGEWYPEKEEKHVLAQLSTYSPIARSLGLTVSRMGWGYQSNAVVDLLENDGFTADSSAIPRPVYPWDNGLKNWEGASRLPYFPSKEDYRLPGLHRNILQVPISTVPLPFPTDNFSGIIRYINPAYQSKYFDECLTKLDIPTMVMITHPYEIIGSSESKSAIAFSREIFTQNLSSIYQEGESSFLTISQLVSLYR